MNSEVTETKRALSMVGGVLLVVLLAIGLAWWGMQRQELLDEQAESAPQLETVTNRLGMNFVLIPGGSFTMGDEGRGFGPEREVQVAPFYLATHEVTQAQWQAVMGSNPSFYKDPRRPVEQVSWLEVQAFLVELNRLEGVNRYRLPTEAEWEYAARAGSDSRFFFGDSESGLRRFAWINAVNGHRPVGQRAANPWGLHDIYGNVWEWVQDCWHENYAGAPSVSKVWGGGDCGRRVMRGGGWDNRAEHIGSAVRGSYLANNSDANSGFRIAVNVQ